jgi:hypothetical protein
MGFPPSFSESSPDQVYNRSVVSGTSKQLVSWKVRPEVLGAVVAFALFAAINRSALVEFLLRAFLDDRRLGQRPALPRPR